MSLAREHAEWRSLVEVSGPFLSVKVLCQAFPQGLDKPADESAVRARLRAAHDEWEEGSKRGPIHQAWIQFVLEELLELDDVCLRRGQEMPGHLEVSVAEQGERLRPDVAVVEPDSNKVRLLVSVTPPGQNLERPAEGQRWKASPATRMMTLLHGTDVRLGLVTNGEDWMLVRTAPNETTTFTSFSATMWLDESVTLRAFRSLLGVRRFFNVAPDQTLEALFEESLQNPHEITDQLGLQVRRAVELLIQTIDRIDRERGRKLLAGANERELFEAAVTVMMRLVFLLAAEERRLIPSMGQSLYDQHYAVSTLREQLQRVADQSGEEVLERRHDAWSRLLATFRAVHGGVQYQDLRLIAYGGTLFDPDRYAFLEGRKKGTKWRETEADPLPIDNRTVLHLLDALQILEVRVPGGGPAEAQRLSFRGLGVEQIGHVYEGLLDHTALRAKEPVVGLIGSKNLEPEISLSRLDEARRKGTGELLAMLQEETGRSEGALKKSLEYKITSEFDRRLAVACAENRALYGEVKRFAGFLREDSYGYPVVIPKGSVYVTQGSDRRSTGTHYTPPSLTEPLVQYTMEPLVYEGPADGKPRSDWKLKGAAAILSLRVCDMAMGSGAFLVQACRYLGTRLVEAWDQAERGASGRLVVTPEGDLSTGDPRERPLPRDVSERIVLAQRFVADRCLYGADMNPMAVEIAKLSLWLTTLQKDRPFTFLDHALRPGDSLAGLTAPEQLEFFNMRPDVEKQLVLQGNELRQPLKRAFDARRKLESFSVVEIGDVIEKERLLSEAQAAMTELGTIADLLVAVTLHGGEEPRAAAALEVGAALKASGSARSRLLDTLADRARTMLGGRKPFQWLLEFPEIFFSPKMEARGFDAVIGNPPFVKGHFISSHFGDAYRDFLVSRFATVTAGLADLVAFFFVNAHSILNARGYMGLIATNTISEGDTNRVAIGQLTSNGARIYRAQTNYPWPGEAAVVVSSVYMAKGSWNGSLDLNGEQCDQISPRLTTEERSVFALAENDGVAFNGFYPNGERFVVSDSEVKAFVADDKESRRLIHPYINGVELYSSPDCRPTRRIISLWDWPEDEAKNHRAIYRHLREHVKPYRETVDRKRTRELWWLYAENRPGLAHAIGFGPMFKEHPKRWKDGVAPATVIAKTKTSQTWAFVMMPARVIFDQAIVVIAHSSPALFALLQSSIHWVWAVEDATRHKTDMRYSPALFETFPRCPLTEKLARIGEEFHEFRADVLRAGDMGLTELQKSINDESSRARQLDRLRESMTEIEREVLTAYGWSDIEADIGFHRTRDGSRFTIGEKARREVMKRLLDLNHRLYAEEKARGLHPDDRNNSSTTKAESKKKGKKPAKKTSRRQTAFDI